MMLSDDTTLTMHIPDNPSASIPIIAGIILASVLAFFVFAGYFTGGTFLRLTQVAVPLVALAVLVTSLVNYFPAKQRHDDAVSPSLSKVINSYGLTEVTKPRDSWSGETTPAYMDMHGKTYYRCNVLTHVHGSTNDVRLACEDNGYANLKKRLRDDNSGTVIMKLVHP